MKTYYTLLCLVLIVVVSCDNSVDVDVPNNITIDVTDVGQITGTVWEFDYELNDYVVVEGADINLNDNPIIASQWVVLGPWDIRNYKNGEFLINRCTIRILRSVCGQVYLLRTSPC